MSLWSCDYITSICSFRLAGFSLSLADCEEGAMLRNPIGKKLRAGYRSWVASGQQPTKIWSTQRYSHKHLNTINNNLSEEVDPSTAKPPALASTRVAALKDSKLNHAQTPAPESVR